MGRGTWLSGGEIEISISSVLNVIELGKLLFSTHVFTVDNSVFWARHREGFTYARSKLETLDAQWGNILKWQQVLSNYCVPNVVYSVAQHVANEAFPLSRKHKYPSLINSSLKKKMENIKCFLHCAESPLKEYCSPFWLRLLVSVYAGERGGHFPSHEKVNNIVIPLAMYCGFTSYMCLGGVGSVVRHGGMQWMCWSVLQYREVWWRVRRCWDV